METFQRTDPNPIPRSIRIAELGRDERAFLEHRASRFQFLFYKKRRKKEEKFFLNNIISQSISKNSRADTRIIYIYIVQISRSIYLIDREPSKFCLKQKKKKNLNNNRYKVSLIIENLQKLIIFDQGKKKTKKENTRPFRSIRLDFHGRLY